MGYEVLTDEQVEHFLTKGYVTVPGCFTQEQARPWLDRMWVRLGYDAHDPSTWRKKRVHMPSLERVDVAEFAPRAWGAMCDLLGGADRIERPCLWGDSFIANLGVGADRPWDPPSPQVPGWHKDGDFFRHYLDSPEQGLLTLVLWSDIEPTGGGTFVAEDSVPVVARYMAEHPEGVHPGEFDFQALVEQCSQFVECTGRLGDVVLLHPYVLHTVSQNVLGTARVITNPPVALREPMRFSRPDGDYSLVEQAVLRGLGLDSLDFVAQGAREEVVPQRVLDERQAKAEEQARLAAAAAG